MTWFWILLFNIAVASLLFLYIRYSLSRALKTEFLLEKVQTQIDEFIRELNSATDRNLSLVEIRLESLSDLMEDANIKMETFDALIKKSEYQREQLESLQSPEETVNFSPVNLIKEGGRIAFSIDQSLKLPAFAASVRGGDRPYQETRAPFSSSFNESNRSLDRNFREREVIGLYNQGISYEMIAKKLKMDLGEVELIISLRIKNSGRFF